MQAFRFPCTCPHVCNVACSVGHHVPGHRQLLVSYLHCHSFNILALTFARTTPSAWLVSVQAPVHREEPQEYAVAIVHAILIDVSQLLGVCSSTYVKPQALLTKCVRDLCMSALPEKLDACSYSLGIPCCKPEACPAAGSHDP